MLANMRSLLAAAPLVLLAMPPAGHAQEAAEDTIHPAAFRAHVEFLADDLLEGREAGTRGYLLAANYVAAQFQAAGLQAAGGDGSYFQPVPLRSGVIVPSGTALTVSKDGVGTALTFEEDFVINAAFAREASEVDAPLVFVGYGVSVPALGYDDYAGIDATGKIVVALSGAPGDFPSDARAHFSSGTAKAVNAADHGAVGTISIFGPDLSDRFPWDALVHSRRGARARWIDDAGMPHDAPSELQLDAFVTMDAAGMLFDGAPVSLQRAVEATIAGAGSAFDLATTLRGSVASEHRDFQAPNIVALLPGSDPALKDEYVVFTAHVDHVGIGAPVDADSIYNGAFDNASGVATLLDVARAFAELPKPPARSLIFVGTAAEEKGLLGADYFVHNPPVPIESMVANVNMDGNLMGFPPRGMHAIGADHSSLGDVFTEVVESFGVDFLPDPMPDQNFFIRSDQYPFIKRGVPALAIINGFYSTDPAIEGMQGVLDWLGQRYHKPSDDLGQPILWEVGVNFARMAFQTGLRIANDPRRPTWNEDDLFGDAFRPDCPESR